MNLKYIFLFIIFSGFLYAQKETTGSSIAFPKMNNNLDIKPKPKSESPEFSISKPFEPKLFKVAPKKYDAPKIDNPIVFTPEMSDLKPGLQYEQKLNSGNSEGNMNFKLYRKNEFFGEFKSQSKTVGILCRDHGNIDGDRIRVWVNGALKIESVTLSGGFQDLNFTLEKGFNKVEIEAINEGIYSPNTAEFQVYDDKGILISANKWNLGTGFKASFVVVKE